MASKNVADATAEKTKTKTKAKENAEVKEFGSSEGDTETPEEELDAEAQKNDTEEVEEPSEADRLLSALEEVLKRGSLVEATKKERKSMYSSELKVSRRGSMAGESVETREERIKKELQLLASASRNGKHIERVHIEGLLQTPQYGYMLKSRLANRASSEFSILIPANELFDLEDKDYGAQAKQTGSTDYDSGKLFLYDLERFIGCDVDVVIFSVNEKERTAYASRLAANAVLTDKLFRRKTQNGRPIVDEGIIRTGTILFPKADRVIVTVDGVDMEIKQPEVSWTNLKNMKEEFSYMQKVNVKLYDIQPDVVREVNNHKLHLAKAKGSIRQAEVNPVDKYWDDFEPEQIYEAEIKSVTSQGKVFVVLCGKLNCMCEPNGVGQAVPGAICLVKVKAMYKENGHILGQIVNIRN